MNRIKLLGILTITILTIISCEKQQDESVGKLNNLALVTGITIIDESGYPLKTYGNPNDTYREYIDDNDGYIGEGKYNYTFYPNPVSDVLKISTLAKIESVWVVKGEVSSNYQDFEFSDYFNSEVIDTVGINRNSSLVFNNLNLSGELNINLSEKVEDGVYKIIVKTENSSILWFSIIKSNEELKTIENKYFPW